MAVKIREKNGKWWLYVDWHGQRKKKCIGTKEAAEKARVMLEARLVLGAKTVFEPIKEARAAACAASLRRLLQAVAQHLCEARVQGSDLEELRARFSALPRAAFGVRRRSLRSRARRSSRS